MTTVKIAQSATTVSLSIGEHLLSKMPPGKQNTAI